MYKTHHAWTTFGQTIVRRCGAKHIGPWRENISHDFKKKMEYSHIYLIVLIFKSIFWHFSNKSLGAPGSRFGQALTPSPALGTFCWEDNTAAESRAWCWSWHRSGRNWEFTLSCSVEFLPRWKRIEYAPAFILGVRLSGEADSAPFQCR